jgi:hypothetical protein
MSLNDFTSAQRNTGFSKGGRAPSDFYQTPRIAIEKLLDYETFGQNILEPCCGAGAISNVLLERGYNVISQDLNDWGYGETGKDFLKEPLVDVDAVVTNPPFNLSYEFVLRSLEATKAKNGKVAMLNRLAWLEGVKRGKMFKSTPLSKVLVFSKRIPRMNVPNYTGKQGTSMLAFCWLIFNWTHEGPPIIDWI